MSASEFLSTPVKTWRAPACQPFGAALFIDDNGTILTLTESTGTFFAAPDAQLLLGQNIEEVCPPLYDVWLERLEGNLDPRDWTRVKWADQEFDARAVPYQEYWLIDVWPAGEQKVGWNDVQTIATIVREWLQHTHFNLNDALGHYRRWLNFDMAVVYHLEDTGEGEIIAEDKEPGLTSLKGLHYTVSQLGNFAQALGYQNVARNIANIQAPSTRWWTIESGIDPAAAELSVCRELDDHHAYLMNTLGFKAALMLPLVMDGTVKGLLIAYNREQRILGGITQLVARTFAQSLSLKINEHELRTRFTYEHELQQSWLAVEHAIITREHNLDDLLQKHGLILSSLVNADGIVRLRAVDGCIETFGDETLNKDAPYLRAWLEWLCQRIPTTIDAYGTGIFATDFLEGSYDNYLDANNTLKGASGTLAMRLPNQDVLVFTRHPTTRSIDTSRRSQWMTAHIRNLEGHAAPWTDFELKNAKAFLRLQSKQFQGTGEQNIVNPEFNYDAVIVYALDGRILYMNAVARRIASDLTSLEIDRQLKIYDLLGYDSDDVKEKVRDAMAHAYHHTTWKGELHIRSKSHHDLMHAVLSGALRRHRLEGAEVYYSWTAKDVTATRTAKIEQQYLLDGIPLAKPVHSEVFRSILAEQMELKKREDPEYPGLLMLIDLDGTKNFIKAIGQDATNEISEWFHRRLLNIMGQNTQVCHLGSDEFAIIIPRLEKEQQAWLIADMVLYNIMRPVSLNNYLSEDAIRLTGCIGMALFPHHGNNAPDLLAAADNAMYAAKRAGKGQVRMHDPDSSVNVSQKFHLVGELRRAIQNNELRAYFQPQINAITKEIIGAEALVRWQHPELGLLQPNMFIHVAEESGLIDKLGEWVLHDTLRQLGTWPNEYRKTVVVSVNASVRQLRDKDHFLYVLDAALEKYNVAPRSLEIEITETIWMGETDAAVKTLNALRERGVSVAIDDFGTGYSNIAYLQNFPVDKLKFDRSFVVAGQESRGGKEILRAMVQLAKALNMDVLAEGVETVEQEQMLLEAGVEKMQGFLYAKPMAEKDFLAVLTSQPKR